MKTERELIQLAIDHASEKHATQTGYELPRWAIVAEVFQLSTDDARALCFKYGYDPDAKVGG